MDDPVSSLSVRGVFSSSLRNRSIWRAIGPVLTAPATNLQESPLQGCDFSLHLESTPHSLQVLLLSPCSIDSHKEETISQLKQLFTVQSAQRRIVAFLLSEGSFNSASGKYSLDGLLALELLIVESIPATMTVLPIPDASCLLSCIGDYIGSLVDIPVQSPSFADSLGLLVHVSSNYSGALSQHDTNILSDLFPSLRVLSQVVRTHEGQELLVDYFGEALARDIVAFWETDVECA